MSFKQAVPSNRLDLIVKASQNFFMAQGLNVAKR